MDPPGESTGRRFACGPLTQRRDVSGTIRFRARDHPKRLGSIKLKSRMVLAVSRRVDNADTHRPQTRNRSPNERSGHVNPLLLQHVPSERRDVTWVVISTCGNRQSAKLLVDTRLTTMRQMAVVVRRRRPLRGHQSARWPWPSPMAANVQFVHERARNGDGNTHRRTLALPATHCPASVASTTAPGV
jgi:hypothetical protein